MDFSKLQMNEDRVLVRVFPLKKLRMVGNLWLPPEHSGKVALVTARIEAVGPGQVNIFTGTRIKPDFKVGDYVQFPNHHGALMNLETAHPDREYRMIVLAEISWGVNEYVEEKDAMDKSVADEQPQPVVNKPKPAPKLILPN